MRKASHTISVSTRPGGPHTVDTKTPAICRGISVPLRLTDNTPALLLPRLLDALRARQASAWSLLQEGTAVSFGLEVVPLSMGSRLTGQVRASASIQGRRGKVRLGWSAADGPHLQMVEVEALPLQGLLRWFWRCPSSGRLCAVLYLPKDAAGFAGRQAHALRYRSEVEKPGQRAMRRAAKLRRALGEDPPVLGGPPPVPPPRMTAGVYLRALEVIREAEAELFGRDLVVVERIARKAAQDLHAAEAGD
jgi:hypothetical protein